MFKKPNGHPQVEEMVAFLGKGTDFKGTLNFEGTIRIDGRLEGEIYTKDTLIIGEAAEVMGKINVGTLISSGRITGNVKAARAAHFIAPGRLDGNVDTPKLKVEEGFSFNGKCEMNEAKEAAILGAAKEGLSEAGRPA